MAKKSTVKTKSIEETLWDSANKLRGTVESSEYKHVVLGLIFLKFASDKFEERRAELIAEGKEKFIEMKEFYNMQNIFYLPEEARWSTIIEHSKQADIALKIDTALHTIEKNNPALKGALPDNYFSRLNMDVSKLAALLDTINNINTIEDKQQDIVGRVYEYFLSKFALAEGKGKGEFYTPKSIVNLIAEMIEPYKGIIYDPACGSGGMLELTHAALAKEQMRTRANQTECESIVSYCQSCAESMSKGRKNGVHLLDLIFTPEFSMKQEAQGSLKKWYNRFNSRQMISALKDNA